MIVLKWLNEKDNVSVKVRDIVRKQVDDKLAESLGNSFDNIENNVNGGYSVQIATDEKTGNPIYAHFNFTVNMVTPNEKKERKPRAKKEVEAVEVPTLF